MHCNASGRFRKSAMIAIAATTAVKQVMLQRITNLEAISKCIAKDTSLMG